MKRLVIHSILVVMFFSIVSSCKKSETQNSQIPVSGDYAVFSWNDLGMHCLNPSYDKLVILPPYNNVWAQVVKRGNPPSIETTGLTVSYKLTNNTYSYGKRAYGGFWDNSLKLFNVTLAHDIGLKGNGLSGNMTLTGDHFIAEGIPVVPVDDSGNWNPFQVAEITVKNSSGTILAQTHNTVPTSDEINCAKCHGTSAANAFDDILAKHDSRNGTTLSSASNQPVLCASCHPSPALGITTGPQMYLSRAIHGFHATQAGITCYDCHPGVTTQCSRSLRHTAADGNCTNCHGDLANVASTIAAGRVPWVTEPKCVTCHSGVNEVDTGSALYRNSKGHGAMYCIACHGSPHAMYPARETSDNYQPVQYQGSAKIKSIASCGVCHNSSRGAGSTGDFAETHGGTNPEQRNGCHICHTVVSTNTASWPHAYTWKNSN